MTSKPQLLRLKQAASLLGISLTTLWRLENTDPDFPKKIILAKRTVGFMEQDLINYLRAKGG